MTADDLFRYDAGELGISLSVYETFFALMLEDGPHEQRVTYNEVLAGLVTQDDIALVSRFERLRLGVYPRNGRRQRSHSIRKAGRFATRAA